MQFHRKANLFLLIQYDQEKILFFLLCLSNQIYYLFLLGLVNIGY